DLLAEGKRHLVKSNRDSGEIENRELARDVENGSEKATEDKKGGCTSTVREININISVVISSLFFSLV
ncbi:hypothetical protein A2U01_0027576, partial [Trifolium medium]|nr:hypothetical protein [Trifolium medium]